MNQPEFKPPYVRVGALGEIPSGQARAYSVGRYEVAVFNVAGTLHALENSCPHQGGPLADGWLEDSLITCPWHGWCFDVRSGKMTLGELAGVPRFAVAVRGDGIYVSAEPLEEV